MTRILEKLKTLKLKCQRKLFLKKKAKFSYVAISLKFSQALKSIIFQWRSVEFKKWSEVILGLWFWCIDADQTELDYSQANPREDVELRIRDNFMFRTAAEFS